MSQESKQKHTHFPFNLLPGDNLLTSLTDTLQLRSCKLLMTHIYYYLQDRKVIIKGSNNKRSLCCCFNTWQN